MVRQPGAHLAARSERVSDPQPAPGTTLSIRCGDVAHGGHVVGRHEGRVVFVRHALPGELVEALVTEGGAGDRFLRADAVRILEPSPHRRTPPCPYAGPSLVVEDAGARELGGCGGCDWQHTDAAYGRELKGRVIAEQLRRLAGLDVAVVVDPVPGDAAGLHWRTRMQYAVDAAGRPGLRAHRGHDVVPVEECLLATEDIMAAPVLHRLWPQADTVFVTDAGQGEPTVVATRGRRDPTATSGEVVQAVRWPGGGADFEVSATGFWQVHRGAPAAFVTHLLSALAPRPGERALDLYAGVGLFAVALAQAVGADGRVLAVESDAAAVAFGKRNTGKANVSGRSRVHWLRGEVARTLASNRAAQGGQDLVVLDPPRKGAGVQVVRAIAARQPRAVGYVACDPASFARDVRTFGEVGYRLADLRGFDAFPMTHHVETIGVLVPA